MIIVGHARCQVIEGSGARCWQVGTRYRLVRHRRCCPGPYLFVCEAVFVYLTEEQVRTVLSQLAHRFEGSVIGFEHRRRARTTVAGAAIFTRRSG